MFGALQTLLAASLVNLLTQLIYTGTKSPQKGILFFCKAWSMPVLFCSFTRLNIKRGTDGVLDFSGLTSVSLNSRDGRSIKAAIVFFLFHLIDLTIN